jgi:hypothetical protein
LGGVAARDAALHGAPRKAMLAEPAGRLTSAIQTRDRLPIQVDDLALCIDPEAGSGIVNNGR